MTQPTVQVVDLAPLLLTIRQAAQLLALSERKIYSLIDGGQLASVKVDRSRRVLHASVQDYVRRLAVEN